MRFPKGKLSEVKFLLGFLLRLAFSSYSSLTAASDDLNLRKTHCFRSENLNQRHKLYINSGV